jgi:hypothetical protein
MQYRSLEANVEWCSEQLAGEEMMACSTRKNWMSAVVVLGVIALAAGLGHTITVGAGYALPPFGIEDAYSGAIGATLHYELQGLFPFSLFFAASMAFRDSFRRRRISARPS